MNSPRRIIKMHPAAKLGAFLICAILVATAPGWRPAALAVYAVLSGLLIVVFRAPVRLVLKRVLAASPIVILTGAMRAYTAGDAQAGLVMAAKAGIVILMFAILTTTTPAQDLLGAMRRLGMPAAAGSVLALMERYVRLLGEELKRMHRARASRTTRSRDAVSRFRGEGQLAGALLLRGWNRSDRVYQAMLARGFNGDWPGPSRKDLSAQDVAIALLMTGGYALARWTV
jgi:cobalt/nickel transport system permease protein